MSWTIFLSCENHQKNNLNRPRCHSQNHQKWNLLSRTLWSLPWVELSCWSTVSMGSHWIWEHVSGNHETFRSVVRSHSNTVFTSVVVSSGDSVQARGWIPHHTFPSQLLNLHREGTGKDAVWTIDWRGKFLGLESREKSSPTLCSPREPYGDKRKLQEWTVEYLESHQKFA